MNATGYTAGSAPVSGGGGQAAPAGSAANLTRLRKDYLSYLGSKTEEIKEQKEARRYYHSAQWSEKATRAFDKRKQPIVTYNREAPKINGVIGLLERLRQDPKGFSRSPEQSQVGPDGEPEMTGAEVATSVLRYVLDEQAWKEKSPDACLKVAVDAIGGIEIIIEKGDHGDPEIGIEVIEPTAFFYDPRSLKSDLSDARFMGVAKWADVEAVIEMFPDKEAEITAAVDNGADLSSNPDSDNKWVSGDENNRKVRLVDHWYIKGGEWQFCMYTGDVELLSGPSYLTDEKGKTFCKYVVFSANVDHDGDRYGFHRNFKSPQDEINQRRSKGLHISNTRRMIIEKGSVDDIEKTRTEAARPDGVIVFNPGMTPPEFEDAVKAQELAAQVAFLEEAKREIDSYGPNEELLGEGGNDMSGRAIQLRQQAGIAQLGPYLLGYKGWKLRVYRAIWNAVQQHWTAERWIRVTDDEGLAQFFKVNEQQTDPNGNPIVDPATGRPSLVRHLGSLDVDIIIDEGSDQITMQADQYDTAQTLAKAGEPIPPEVIIELSPLDPRVKKKVQGIIAKDQQQKQQAAAPMLQLEARSKDAQNTKTMADARLSLARANSEGAQQPNGADPAQLAFDKWKALLESYTSIRVAEIGKGATITTAAMDADIDRFLGLTGLANDQVMQLRDHAHQQMITALQPQPEPAQAAQ